MENNLTEEQRKLLTEWLGESYHSYVFSREFAMGFPHDVSKCSCGLTGYSVREICTKANRTFTTWQDLGDLKEKLVEKGLDMEFGSYSYDVYFHDINYSGEDWAWYLDPIRFCHLVAEFKPWERGK